jgi:hypothetical protein
LFARRNVEMMDEENFVEKRKTKIHMQLVEEITN